LQAVMEQAGGDVRCLPVKRQELLPGRVPDVPADHQRKEIRMKLWMLLAAGLTTLALGACANMSTEGRTVAGAAGGAAAGLIAAEALDASNEWRLISALGGAAAGTVVAQNTQNGNCAYARGDGTYYTAPCR
jgi:hypothetical protein